MLLIAYISLYRKVMINFVFSNTHRNNFPFHHEFGSIFSTVNRLTVKQPSLENILVQPLEYGLIGIRTLQHGYVHEPRHRHGYGQRDYRLFTGKRPCRAEPGQTTGCELRKRTAGQGYKKQMPALAARFLSIRSRTGRRTINRGRIPRYASCREASMPINPVAPITKTFCTIGIAFI
jgi:hypothetical protein